MQVIWSPEAEEIFDSIVSLLAKTGGFPLQKTLLKKRENY